MCRFVYRFPSFSRSQQKGTKPPRMTPCPLFAVVSSLLIRPAPLCRGFSSLLISTPAHDDGTDTDLGRTCSLLIFTCPDLILSKWEEGKIKSELIQIKWELIQIKWELIQIKWELIRIKWEVIQIKSELIRIKWEVVTIKWEVISSLLWYKTHCAASPGKGLRRNGLSE